MNFGKKYFAAGSLSLLLALLGACEDSATKTETVARQPQTVSVLTEPVVVRRERTRVEAVGNSRALHSVILFPAAAGEVVSVHFDPGDFVDEGELLMELDQRDQKLAVELAAVRVEDAERLFERYQKSAGTGATLPTTLDAAQTTLRAARIEFDRAKVALDDRSLRAPFAGYVGLTDIDSGDRVQLNTHITTLDDRSTLLVSFAVPEILVGKLKEGDQVALSTWSPDGVVAAGRVIDLDSRIDTETRTFVARARVDNVSDQLRPGMSFRVLLDIEGGAYPVLSEVAVQWGANGAYVWSVVNGKARRVPVNIIQRQQGTVLVESNLQPGELVVVEGVQRMRPGIPVALREENTPGTTTNTDNTDNSTQSALPDLLGVGPG